MALRRSLGAAASAAALVFAFASCAPEPTAPAAAPNAGLIGGLLGTVGDVTGSLLSCNVTTAYSAAQDIGPAGGTLRVGPHALVVPPGALAQTVHISAYAPAGSTVRVQFQPEGLHFAAPTALRMSYQSCGLVPSLLLQIVYVDDSNDSVLEVLPSLTDVLTRTVTGKVSHFSSYALAYGFTGSGM